MFKVLKANFTKLESMFSSVQSSWFDRVLNQAPMTGDDLAKMHKFAKKIITKVEKTRHKMVKPPAVIKENNSSFHKEVKFTDTRPSTSQAIHLSTVSNSSELFTISRQTKDKDLSRAFQLDQQCSMNGTTYGDLSNFNWLSGPKTQSMERPMT